MQYFLKIFLIPGLFYIVAFQATAQKKERYDSVILKEWIQQGLNLESSDSDSALAVYKKVITAAQKTNYMPALAKGYHYAGIMLAVKGSFDSALIYYHTAINFYQQLNDLGALGRCYMNIANVYQYQGAYKNAMPWYFKSVKFLEAAKDTSRLSAALSNLGNIFQDLKEFDKASHYFTLSVSYAKAIKDSFRLGNVLINMGALNSVQGKYDTAIVYFKNGLTIAYLLNNDEMIRDALADVGDTYLKLGQKNIGVGYLNNALTFARKINYPYDIAQILITLGKYEAENHSNIRANQYLSEAISIADSLQLYLLMSGAYEQLAKVKYDQGQFKEAYNYHELFKRYSDTVFNEDMVRQINETESKYQVQKKQDSILVLQQNTELQKMEIHKRKTMNVVLVAGCAILLLLIGLFYLNFKRKNQLLKQSEQIHAHQIREMEKQQQLTAMQSVLRGQEEERSRLAKDLHDGVGGLLSGVKLSLSGMTGNIFLSEQNATMLNNVVHQLDQSIRELRRVSHNMMPESLIKFGLADTLVSYCDTLNDSGQLQVTLQTYGMQERMDQNTEIVLYRIVQELLNNVIKHAQAKNVLVQLVRKNDRFNLTVEDDGKGFDPGEKSQEGAGLGNVKARAEYLGASVDIQSAPGEGTSVNIEGNIN